MKRQTERQTVYLQNKKERENIKKTRTIIKEINLYAIPSAIKYVCNLATRMYVEGKLRKGESTGKLLVSYLKKS